MHENRQRKAFSSRLRLRGASVSLAAAVAIAVAVLYAGCSVATRDQPAPSIIRQAVHHDVAAQLLRLDTGMATGEAPGTAAPLRDRPPARIDSELPRAPDLKEQLSHGSGSPAQIAVSFDGIGAGFDGPQGIETYRNPSDNSLAVGPNHIIQTVNSFTAIFTKKGKIYNSTGRALYGPVETRNVFREFGGPCETFNNGDAVVRYDQLADRWLVVMPVFTRSPVRADEPARRRAGEPAGESHVGRAGQPGRAVTLLQPLRPDADEREAAAQARRATRAAARVNEGSYAMCYAVSASGDPFGAWYRYEFVRPLFPDYPRPAVWPDGYYIPTSTGDDVIEKHACVADRRKMLLGEPATEQCVILDGVNFLNNADVDGFVRPPEGAPNIMMATGGAQLRGNTEDDGIYVWKFHVDWEVPGRTRLDGPEKIVVEPYAYLCGGQLTECVPQPGTDQRLDSQGDKIMSRLVYRRLDDQQSIVAVHSVNTSDGRGGVRWYEFRLDSQGDVRLHQQGTYAPEEGYRWMASPAMDGLGNIGIGYSYSSASDYPGQRFAGRRPDDPLGVLGLRETVLVEGQAAQTGTLRWQDYTQTAVDPVDDCTIWYVGDYVKAGAESYSTRIGAFQMPGCNGW